MLLTREHKFTLADLLFLLILLCLGGFQYLYAALTNPVFGGWDGVSHVAIARDYVGHTWPDIFGWTPNWYLGMPFPNHYQPLFFWTTGLISRVTTLDPETVIQGMCVIGIFCVPILMYAICKKHCGGRAAGLAGGLFAVYLMTRRDAISSNGISIFATFFIGLLPHLFAFVLMMLWFYFAPGARSSRRAFLWATIFLSLTLLANANLAPVSFIVFLSFFLCEWLVSQNRLRIFGSIFRTYFVMGLLVLGLIAAWYLPMFSTYQWVASKTLAAAAIDTIPSTRWQLTFLFAISIFICAWGKCVLGLSLGTASLLLTLANLAYERDLFLFLPIQPQRIAATTLFLMVPAGAFFVGQVAQLSSRAWVQTLLVILLPFALFLSTFDNIPLKDFLYVYSRDERAEMEHVAQLVSDPRKGRFTVEMIPDRPFRNEAGWYLNGLAGNAGGFGLHMVFREATISSYFADPLRNAYSDMPLVWGFDSFLGQDLDFVHQDLERHKSRNNLFNLKYFLIHSPFMRKRFRESPDFTESHTGPQWSIFETTYDPGTYAFVPDAKPFLIQARFTAKGRPIDVGQYDFITIAEYLFENDEKNVTLALSPFTGLDDPKLTSNETLRRYSGLVVTDYAYEDANEAKKRLTEFAKTRPVFLLDAGDPLSSELLQSSGANFHAIPRIKIEGTEAEAKQMKLMLSDLRFVLALFDMDLLKGLADAQEGPAEQRAIYERVMRELLWRDIYENGAETIRNLLGRYVQTRIRFREGLRTLRDNLDRHKIPIQNASTVQSALLDRSSAIVYLTETPRDEIPIVIKQSYFPRWFHGERPVGLISPSLQLVFSDEKDITLTFRRIWSDWIGVAISLMTILGLLVWYFRKRKIQGVKISVQA